MFCISQGSKRKGMNNFKKILTSCLLIMLAPIKASAFIDGDFFLNPYVATEAAWRTLSWETGYGEDHFKEEFSNVNLIAGAQFHKHFAVEAGVQTTNRLQKQMHYPGDGNVGGGPVLGFWPEDGLRDAVTHFAEAQVKGWHLNLLGLWPVPSLNDTTLYTSVGVAWMRFNVSTVPVIDGNAANFVSHWKSSQDAIFRFGLGVKHMITDNFAARIFFNWENTGSLNGTALVPESAPPQGIYTAKMKSSSLVGLGFYYQFCPHRNAS